MGNEVETRNTAVLANATELTTHVVMKIAGNAIANTLDGELITPTALRGAIVAKLQSCISASGAK